MTKIAHSLTTLSTGIIILISLFIVIEQLIRGEIVSTINLLFIEIIITSISYTAWQSQRFYLYLPALIIAIILVFCTFYLGVTPVNWRYCLQAVVSFMALLSSFVLCLTNKAVLSTPLPKTACLFSLILMALFLVIWGGNTLVHKMHTEGYDSNIWAVPLSYEKSLDEGGHLELITYQTKAYATNQRPVTKNAYVYLPPHYDASRQYDILYLMHGTGDDESYWFKNNPQNKNMVDQLIDKGDIPPMIIVTPTFYVENDCENDLDQLTYSFQYELQNDLMPAIESHYSTYAQTIDSKGFTDSRDHRAFAGLSRGAVTTLHSALCAHLDYFAWFGAFSGSRTDGQELAEHIQTSDTVHYPIHYFYMSSGTFDLALSGQLKDYDSLLMAEPRLKEGQNTRLEIFPMRYHSTGSWHLALYQFLPHLFKQTP